MIKDMSKIYKIIRQLNPMMVANDARSVENG